MPEKPYRTFQALLLLALCLFLAAKFSNGQLTYYINLRFVPLTILGMVLLAALAQAVFTETRRPVAEAEADHDHGFAAANLWIMAVPLAVGLLIPARPLDSSAFSTKGFNTSGALVSSDSAARLFETDSQERNVLDWLEIFNYQKDLAPYLGQPASVVGFVFRDEQLAADQFYVSRYIITCCAADGFAVALVAEWPDAAGLENDTWVVVRGTVDSILLNDHPVPLIRAESVEDVPVPEQPYLYP